MKALILKFNLILFFLAFIALSPSIAGQRIIVRIINPHPFPVLVHSRSFNAYGQPNWNTITQVPPRSYVDIPNVPVGAMLGVGAPNKRRSWPPFQVRNLSRYIPNFEYKVPR